MADDERENENENKKSDDATPPVGRHLLRARSVLLFGPIEPKLTRMAVTQLLALNQMSKTKPIRVYVNSPGGYAHDGFAIYDMIRFISAPVMTICTGLAASAATIVMVAAEKDMRFSLPRARMMLHQPSQAARGTASDIEIAAKEILRLRKEGNELFARETGQPIEKIEKDMHRDFWMSADESLEYGLVSKIVGSESDLP